MEQAKPMQCFSFFFHSHHTLQRQSTSTEATVQVVLVVADSYRPVQLATFNIESSELEFLLVVAKML